MLFIIFKSKSMAKYIKEMERKSFFKNFGFLKKKKKKKKKEKKAIQRIIKNKLNLLKNVSYFNLSFETKDCSFLIQCFVFDGTL
jgi:hypothetical protein